MPAEAKQKERLDCRRPIWEQADEDDDEGGVVAAKGRAPEQRQHVGLVDVGRPPQDQAGDDERHDHERDRPAQHDEGAYAVDEELRDFGRRHAKPQDREGDANRLGERGVQLHLQERRRDAREGREACVDEHDCHEVSGEHRVRRAELGKSLPRLLRARRVQCDELRTSVALLVCCGHRMPRFGSRERLRARVPIDVVDAHHDGSEHQLGTGRRSARAGAGEVRHEANRDDACEDAAKEIDGSRHVDGVLLILPQLLLGVDRQAHSGRPKPVHFRLPHRGDVLVEYHAHDRDDLQTCHNDPRAREEDDALEDLDRSQDQGGRRCHVPLLICVRRGEAQWISLHVTAASSCQSQRGEDQQSPPDRQQERRPQPRKNGDVVDDVGWPHEAHEAAVALIVLVIIRDVAAGGLRRRPNQRKGQEQVGRDVHARGQLVPQVVLGHLLQPSPLGPLRCSAWPAGLVACSPTKLVVHALHLRPSPAPAPAPAPEPEPATRVPGQTYPAWRIGDASRRSDESGKERGVGRKRLLSFRPRIPANDSAYSARIRDGFASKEIFEMSAKALGSAPDWLMCEDITQCQ
eukprot:scaffold2975_cov248-Pinguiococcus_pyrenoidosus.AAC.1